MVMNRKLRTILCSLLVCTIAEGGAQTPLTGTYKIKSSAGTYVQIKSKYYAKPDANADNASKVGVGIGYKDGDNGYRVYSLTGKNPTDGSAIEVYDYVDKACQIVSQFAQGELNKKLSTLLSGLSVLTDEQKEQLLPALDAMADSICRIYTDDYAYMTVIPQAHYGNKWIVRAKATVPAIPYTIQAVGNYVVVGSDVRGDGHKSTDVWDWAKQHVLKYLDENQTDQRLKDMAKKYLDQVVPGTTYYLSYDASDTSFGYELTPSDKGLWTMEAVSTTADGLTPGVKNIKNNATDRYVNVTGKYEAEPNLTLSDIESNVNNKKNAAISLDFGRYDRNYTNFYRVTELSNQGQDVVDYLSKGMDKVFEVLDGKLKTTDNEGKTAYDKIASIINGMLTSKGISYSITADNVRADVQTAVDLCSEHYAYMKLIDNGDGSVKLRTDVPKVPVLLDLAVEMYQQYKNQGQWQVSDEEVEAQGAKGYEGEGAVMRANGDGTSAFEEFAKEQITNYFNNSQTEEALKKLWNQNKDKWHFGKNYYLSAESAYNTFEFTEDGNDASTLWTLVDVNADNSTTNPYKGYFRIKNVGGYNDQQYIEVRGRATADASATNADKVTKPGSVLYVNLDANPTIISSPYTEGQTVKAYELMNLRSQGVDVMNGCETSTDKLAGIFSFKMDDIAGTIRGAYNGYVGFARYMLSLGASFADQHIRGYVSGADNQAKFDNLMADFNTNYLPNLKFQVYLIPVDGQKDTYLVRSKVPSVKPIVDFYNANKTDMDNIVVPAVRTFLNKYSGLTDRIGFTGEKFTQEDDEMINSWYSTDGGEWHVKNCCEKDENGNLKGDGTKEKPWTLSYSTILGSEQIMFDWLKLQIVHALNATVLDATLGGYVNMIHYNTPYYLIEGDNHDANGQRKYTGNAGLGFANDGFMANTGEGQQGSIVNDLKQAGDHAYWTLEPVDETNYFTVKPNKNEGRNGKYYSSTYLDFPFQIKGSGVSAVYKVAGEVQSDTDENGNAIQYVTFNKVDQDVIPAATPVIIEFNSNTVSSDLALEPVMSNERSDQSKLIQGTFFGGKHNASSDGGILSSLIGTTIDSKYGTTTNGQDLYLFGYNKKDSYNPYGFYRYSKADEAEDSNYNLIPANKPFLIMDTDSKAKVYVLFEDEPTGINALMGDTDTVIPADAPRYNLAGQRVDKTYKGVVIVNGHKFIQQ